jgi:hypothetical protein
MLLYGGDLNALVPDNHPLRTVRAVFDEFFATRQHGPVPPYEIAEWNTGGEDKLLRLTLLQILYAIPSEQQLLERLEFDVLFRWFVGSNGAGPLLDCAAYSNGRRQLLSNEAAVAVLRAVLAQRCVEEFLASELFWADGSLFEVWANALSFQKHGMLDEAAPRGDDNPHQLLSVNGSYEEQLDETHCFINFLRDSPSGSPSASDSSAVDQRESVQWGLDRGHNRDLNVEVGRIDPYPSGIPTAGISERIAPPSAAIGPLHPDDRPVPTTSGADWGLRLRLMVGALALCSIVAVVDNPLRLVEILGGGATLRPVIDSIILAESSGCANAKNERSTALGPGQFLNQTWLELIRAYRPDLARVGEAEVLELRRDRQLAREMTIRFAERNRSFLQARGVPVTPGSVYLSHFAGPAGAVALLTASDELDAATVMAKADVTGRTTREEIVTANPFLGQFTVGDLKRWADGKMQRTSRNGAVTRQC